MTPAEMLLHCQRCDHSWLRRTVDPKQAPKTCPKCRSPYWFKPRKQPKGQS